MTNTDLIVLITILTFASTAGVYVLLRKINQYTPTPENLLSRRGDIELIDYIEPTQPLPVYYPTGYSEPINLIQSNPLGQIESNGLDSITVIEGLNSDHINSILELSRETISDIESLDYDSLNLQPIDYNIQDLYIHCFLENENNSYFIIRIILFIIILFILTYLFIIIKNQRNKPANTFFNKNYVNK
jgi:hypothetical protein